MTTSQWYAKINEFKTTAREYINSVKNRKTVVAFNYKAHAGTASELKDVNQVSVVAVPELINYVLTAGSLGFITELRATTEGLQIVFVAEVPTAPISLMY